MSNPSDHRARAGASKAERVAYIMGEISEGRWKGYRSTHECAEAWGISVRAVAGDAAEAGRTLQQLHAGTPEQRQEATGRQLARLEHWREVALTAKGCPKCGTPGPDMGAIARLEDLEARITGTPAPTKVEHKDTTDRYGEMSPEERIKLHEAAIEEERAKLAEGMH